MNYNKFFLGTAVAILIFCSIGFASTYVYYYYTNYDPDIQVVLKAWVLGGSILITMTILMRLHLLIDKQNRAGQFASKIDDFVFRIAEKLLNLITNLVHWIIIKFKK